jgi:hypothetical protein
VGVRDPRMRMVPRAGDTVNHPDHYTHGGIEVIDFLVAKGLDRDYFLGNVVKYIARAPHKGKELEDLKKAAWYLNYRIKMLEGDFDEEPDLDKCPKCRGPADNGHDRCLPPNPYACTICCKEEEGAV